MRNFARRFRWAAFGLALLPGASAFPAYERSKDPTAEIAEKNLFLENAVREAAAAVFRRDAAALNALAQKVRQYEDENPAAMEGFRLSDDLRELSVIMIPDRAQRMEEMAAAKEGADSYVKSLLNERIQEDPLKKADSLKSAQRWNGMASGFNATARNLASLANGNTQALAQMLAGLFLGWAPSGRMSEWERQQRALYEQYLKENPKDAEVAAKKRELDGKLKAQQGKDLRKYADLYVAQDRPREALYMAEKASANGADAGDSALEASRSDSSLPREQAKTLIVQAAQEGFSSGEEAASAQRMLVLLAAGKNNELEQESRRFANAYPESMLRDEAIYLAAMAAGWAGKYDQRQELLDRLVAEETDDNMAEHALNRSNSPYTNPATAHRAAEAEHSDAVWGYVWKDKLQPSESLDKAWEEGFKPGSPADALKPVFFIDTIVRGIKAAAGAGPSDENVRDAAAARLRQNPGSSQAQELAAGLGRQAEKSGKYNQALVFYEKANADMNRKGSELREKEARDLYIRVSALEDPALKQKHLERLAREYGDTKYGARASQGIGKAIESQRVEMTKAKVQALPALWRGRGLRWPDAWFDGSIENGELDDRGLVMHPPDFAVVDFRLVTPTGVEARRQQLSGAAHQEARAALGERDLSIERLEAAETLIVKRRLPLEVQGSVGTAGLLVYPSIIKNQMSPEEARLYK